MAPCCTAQGEEADLNSVWAMTAFGADAGGVDPPPRRPWPSPPWPGESWDICPAGRARVCADLGLGDEARRSCAAGRGPRPPGGSVMVQADRSCWVESPPGCCGRKAAPMLTVELGVGVCPGCAVVALGGEPNAGAAAADGIMARTGPGRRVAAARGDLQFTACHALDSLAWAAKRARWAGGGVFVAAPRVAVLWMLDLTVLSGVFCAHARVAAPAAAGSGVLPGDRRPGITPWPGSSVVCRPGDARGCCRPAGGGDVRPRGAGFVSFAAPSVVG